MKAESLRFTAFRHGDPLSSMRQSPQRDYLIEYLADLDVKTILQEKYYFDRDYLAEFSTFYSTSTQGYANTCSRLHFFAETIDRRALSAAASGDERTREILRSAYRGFVVIRPIPVRLKPSAPAPLASRPGRFADPTKTYPEFIPEYIVAGVHEGLRTLTDKLHAAALELTNKLREEVNRARRGNKLGLTLSTRFRKLSDYLGDELGNTLKTRPASLRRTRLQLCEKVPPMSLHVGVARIGWGPIPLVNILYDTTDAESNLRAFCHVLYESSWNTTVKNAGINLGVPVSAY